MNVQAPSRKTPLQLALDETAKADIELAFEIGVNVTTIWRWRVGKSIPTSQAIREAIADALGRHVDELWPPEPGALAA